MVFVVVEADEGFKICVSVCVSVTALAATAFVSACNQRHLRHLFRLFLDLNSWIFEKAFRSKVMAEKANMQIS